MKDSQKRVLKLGLILVIIIAVALIVYPFLPLIKYNLFYKPEQIGDVKLLPGVEEVNDEKSEGAAVITGEIASESSQIGNLLIIPKIGVRIAIVEGRTEATLNKGAWRLPETSTPDKGNNTVLTGHRWKYRPPSEKTFYLLDKLKAGDTFQIIWQGKEYNYKIISTFIVEPKDVWVLNPTKKSIATLITCTPLFSTEKRLIVKGELVE
ncbi:MAG: hypothetical protein A2V69_03665 [Candidatus Portnoybacteria bacterium RBG_13_40_8]|uniref:Sortase n=1 Tax=Candidatus Portnoybacteria bacterium RBG_13_40_8 TaxID=1801990 RepID=A0A1G2F3L8_9BACT|nr:MAG: hypothetical protein A2V69_03665 [Candidatus Portnoybacteria bacterium RBG_13_40_8]